jgi:hypothetical protein
MKKIEKLLSGGKSPKEVIGMGFAHSTVYVVAKKVKSKTVKNDFEVELDIYDLIQQMAQWIELLAIDSGFSDGTNPVPCLYCAGKGKADYMMKQQPGGGGKLRSIHTEERAYSRFQRSGIPIRLYPRYRGTSHYRSRRTGAV